MDWVTPWTLGTKEKKGKEKKKKTITGASHHSLLLVAVSIVCWTVTGEHCEKERK
jgi:hypothetical protein